MTDAASDVGFVGIGNMGWPMAANLVSAGFDVRVSDAVAGRAERFASEIGGRPLDSAADVDVIITMLPTSQQVLDVLDPLVEHLRSGTLVIEMSSGVPASLVNSPRVSNAWMWAWSIVR